MSTGIHLGKTIVEDVLPTVLPEPFFNTCRARVQLAAIGLQESRFEVRRQYNNGPAASFWQFEPGGIRAVMHNPDTEAYARRVLDQIGIQWRSSAVWSSMLLRDDVGVAFARLLLWSDRHALPAVGDVEGAWKYYLRNWRPGKPVHLTWARLYAEAVTFMS